MAASSFDYFRDQRWKLDAKCLDSENPDAFFDDYATPKRAKELCQGCPVQTECLNYAITAQEPHGIWGGLSATERKLLLRRMNRLSLKFETLLLGRQPDAVEHPTAS